MLNKYNITKLPVVIVSGARTGSTALAYDIRDECILQGIHVQLFNEPIGNHEKDTFLKLGDSNYILKAHAHDLVKSYSKNILDMIYKHECFLVRIRRKDIVNQIVSCHIATTRNAWGYYTEYTSQEQLTMAEQPIQLTRDVRNTIHRIMEENEVLNNFPAEFDLDLFYEDIEIKSQHLLRTPKPKNYDDIVITVKRILSDIIWKQQNGF